MPSSQARIWLWCEDREHEAFARHLLKERFGLDARRLFVKIAPRGEGAASAWVLRKYQEEVLPTARRARHQLHLGFLVLVDGDNVGWRRRVEQFEEAGGKEPRPERIAICAPTWSIETWVLWLCGEDVSEALSLKSRLPAMEFRTRLGKAIELWEPPRQTETECLPSLTAGRVELDRLPLR